MTKAEMIETLLKKEAWTNKKCKIVRDKYGEGSVQHREACAEWYIAFSLTKELGIADKRAEYRK